jgi:hypothetical protein
MATDHPIFVPVNPASCKIIDPGTTHGRKTQTFAWSFGNPFVAKLEIIFDKGGTPFSSSRFSTTQPHVETGPGTAIASGSFDYRIKVTLNDGTSCEIDPRVVIADGTRESRPLSRVIMGAAAAGIGAFLVAWGINSVLRRRQE